MQEDKLPSKTDGKKKKHPLEDMLKHHPSTETHPLNNNPKLTKERSR